MNHLFAHIPHLAKQPEGIEALGLILLISLLI